MVLSGGANSFEDIMLKMYVFSILINEVTEVNLVQYANGPFSASN